MVHPADCRHLGLVLQDVFLFSGDVAANITLGDSRISEQRMIEASDRVHIAPFIETLPGGYREEVQERGSTFSQGQRQLLSFARALAFDPKIFILDEATSSVDRKRRCWFKTPCKNCCGTAPL